MEHQKQHLTCTMSRNDDEARNKQNSALQKLKEEQKKTEQLEYEFQVVNAETKFHHFIQTRQDIQDHNSLLLHFLYCRRWKIYHCHY